MHCELVVPGLLSANSPGRWPSIELLLARGRRENRPAIELEPLLTEIFGLRGNNIPAGALTVLAGNGDPGGGRWARADPVHLSLMRDRLVVVPGEALAISREEADALCAALNRHFGAFEIRAFDSRRWSARLEGETKVPDVPAVCAGGQEAAPARENRSDAPKCAVCLSTSRSHVRRWQSKPSSNDVLTALVCP